LYLKGALKPGPYLQILTGGAPQPRFTAHPYCNYGEADSSAKFYS